jgi:hypothetical protein
MHHSQGMRSIIAAAALFMAAAGPAFANTVTFGISITKNATASLSLSTSTFTWANITDSTNTSLAADNNPNSANVTGTMLTTYSSGSGQIVVASPANLTGTNGGTLPINALQIQCSGSAQTGQTFNAATPTALTASASTTCASYAAGYYTPVSFKLLMFVDDSRFPADTYSSASGFSLVATAT